MYTTFPATLEDVKSTGFLDDSIAASFHKIKVTLSLKAECKSFARIEVTIVMQTHNFCMMNSGVEAGISKISRTASGLKAEVDF